VLTLTPVNVYRLKQICQYFLKKIIFFDTIC
jgi:hypothetical protein